MYITLSESRQNLNITDDFFTEDDCYISSLILAAEKGVENFIDRPLESCVDRHTGELGASLRQAILMLVGSAYNFRESITVQNIKTVPIYDMLLAPYRRHSVG